MPIANSSIIVGGGLCAAILLTAACSPRRIPPMTVADLMEDRVTLDGVLLKCNQNPGQARNATECLNARIAVDRLASQADQAIEAKRIEDFERSREQLRVAQDKLRREQEAKTKVDAYHLPLVPVDPAPAPTPDEAKQPPLGRTSP
ncbi:MAG: EexN family lipoprotein [Pseudomonadota bacterium]|nr:EexN family lipoprotein [Pseudomonadota bacterium]